MAERELRQMSRAELIEIIYALKQREEDLVQEKAALERRLADRTLRMEQAGNIAQAALELNHVFEAAQAAAEQYLASVRAMDKAAPSADAVRLAAQAEADALRAQAKRESEAILAQAQRQKALVEKECAAQRARTEREVRQRWDAFEEQAQKVLEGYTKVDVLPAERGAE